MTSFKDIIIPYSPAHYGGDNKYVLMLQNGSDRSFFESPVFTGDQRNEQAIKTMRAQGGIDLSQSSLSDLSQVASIPERPGMFWIGAAITDEDLDGVRSRVGNEGIFIVPLLGVWSELWNIPDVAKKTYLSTYWEMHILRTLRSI